METQSFTPPERLFSVEQLARLLEITSEVDCECPNHLSRIVDGLLAFEEYSANCESRDAEDAALHAYLHKETAKARAIMETALVELVRFEKIEL